MVAMQVSIKLYGWDSFVRIDDCMQVTIPKSAEGLFYSSDIMENVRKELAKRIANKCKVKGTLVTKDLASFLVK